MYLLKDYIRPFFLLLLAAYFIFAGAVQYNDPDPLHWMLIYFASALVCFLYLSKRGSQAVAFLVAGMALSEMAITLGGLADWLRLGNENILTAPMSATKPYIELTREFFGAAISFAVMLWLALSRRKNAGSA